MSKETTMTVKCVVAMLALIVSSEVLADKGWYLGGALGQAYVDENIEGLQFTADSTAFRVFGGYNFNETIGLEVSYLDLGTFRDSFDVAGETVDVSANADGFSLAAVGTLPLSQRFSLQGKAGLFFWDGQSTVAGITENDPSDQNAFVGLGLAYDLSDKARLNLGVDYYNGSDAQPLLASVGFAFRF